MALLSHPSQLKSRLNERFGIWITDFQDEIVLFPGFPLDLIGNGSLSELVMGQQFTANTAARHSNAVTADVGYVVFH